MDGRFILSVHFSSLLNLLDGEVDTKKLSRLFGVFLKIFETHVITSVRISHVQFLFFYMAGEMEPPKLYSKMGTKIALNFEVSNCNGTLRKLNTSTDKWTEQNYAIYEIQK